MHLYLRKCSEHVVTFPTTIPTHEKVNGPAGQTNIKYFPILGNSLFVLVKIDDACVSVYYGIFFANYVIHILCFNRNMPPTNLARVYADILRLHNSRGFQGVTISLLM